MTDATGSACLVAFEGGEATGKSTQAEVLAGRIGALLTREPGGTDLGARLRSLLLDTVHVVDPRAEALLMAADRAQHVAEVIAPALRAGRHVVTDRYVGSSLAYQGYGRGLPIQWVRDLSVWATGGVEADVVVLLDVPDEVASARLGDERDRFEAEGPTFHRRVLDGYRRLAAGEPERWAVVDGVGSVEEVAGRVWAAVTARCPDLAGAG